MNRTCRHNSESVQPNLGGFSLIRQLEDPSAQISGALADRAV